MAKAINETRNLSISSISGSRNIIYPFFDVWCKEKDILASKYDNAHIVFLVYDKKITLK